MAADSLCNGAAMEDVAMPSASERRSREQLPLPVPSAFSVALTLKVGVPFGTSRSSYGAPQALQLDVVDGYLGFCARVHRKIDQMKEIEWPGDGPILLKPTAGATQAKFVALAEGDAELAREIDAAAQDHEVPREFVKIRCRLNGGLVPLDLNLADLRDALGLPSYDRRPPYRPPVASSAPTVNMEDEDHMHSPDVSME
ncbi:unnamed protein product [Phytophthora fragariaefolia]|uniref:Unnamed protein product n=1 Tax=Phytophthora fragariaefolia TaxID=1490495 RepID=A0A9W6XRA3_9STRA|nr:unnamed protein product [Phytophthora fragariaefolia]